MNFPIPPNETTRLAALRSLHILDTTPSPPFDSLVRLACHLLDMPIAAISLVDQHRQWFKAVEGLDCKETSREIALTVSVIDRVEAMSKASGALRRTAATNSLLFFPPVISVASNIDPE